MRIKEFRIINYGPLSDKGKITLDLFNLIYGVNETGKTLTLEALIKLLLGRNSRYFKNIDRVEEEPEGYVVIATEEGERKLSKKIHLDDLLPISKEEWRNIFIIRNSDLSIDSEPSLYSEITNRLTGLKTKRIKLLKEKILEITQLTPSCEFSNKKEDGFLKSKIKKSLELLEEIKELKNQLKEEGLEELEKKLIEISDTLIEKEILKEKFEEARKRLTYEKASSASRIIKESEEKLKDLEIFTEEDYNIWREVEKELKRMEREIKESKEELSKTEEKIEVKGNELNEIRGEFKIIEKKKTNIDKANYELTNLKEKFIEVSSKASSLITNVPLFVFSMVMLFISFLGFLKKDLFIFKLFTLFFTMLSLILLFLQIKIKRVKLLWEKNFLKLKLSLAENGIKGEEFEEILEEIARFTSDFEKRKEEIKEMEIEIETLKNKRREILNKISKLEREIEKGKEIIEKIKSKILLNKIEDFKEKLEKKKELQMRIREGKKVLESLLGIEPKEKLKELEPFKDKALDINFEEKEYEKLNREISNLKEEKSKYEQNFLNLSKRFEEIERKANEILPEETFLCNGLRDLENIYIKIKNFVKEKEDIKEDAKIALNILREIEEEEKNKIEELFGEESSVSFLFSEMTKGVYINVEFEIETEEIKVTKKDGTRLSPWQLSGGAYDQLYFAIRLALGEKLLSDKKGFFILDDPFIKASSDRLLVLVNMLRNICLKGWQIIYFSAKEEILKIFSQDKKVKIIKME